MKRRFINYGTMFLLSVVVGLLAYMISNRIMISHSDDIFGKYSTEDYEYLLEIVEKAVVEGKDIHTQEIPKDVYYKIEQSSNEEAITFTCSLIKRELYSPEMTITLSKEDKKILSKDFIETEEDYNRMCNRQAKFFSVAIGIACAIVIMAVYTMYSNIQMSKSKH